MKCPTDPVSKAWSSAGSAILGDDRNPSWARLEEVGHWGVYPWGIYFSLLSLPRPHILLPVSMSWAALLSISFPSWYSALLWEESSRPWATDWDLWDYQPQQFSPFKLLFLGICPSMKSLTQERSIKRWEPASVPMQGPENTGLCGKGLLYASKCWPSYLVCPPESWKLPQACGQRFKCCKEEQDDSPYQKHIKKCHGDSRRAWNQTPPGKQ